jgi:Methyltransferase domain
MLHLLQEQNASYPNISFKKTMFKLFKKPRTQGLGLEYRAGGEHYRSFVGPPGNYDLVAAMVFNLLTCAGLRQYHKLLDIGCGSLRIGRLLIPYLNPGNYVGIEPNRWLVEDGIMNEVGWDQISLKRPTFSYRESLQEFTDSLEIDYALAQSIFSHCGLDLIDNWLMQVSMHLKPTGGMFATFFIAETDYQGKGWVYPTNVKYKMDTISAIAARNGLKFTLLEWKHPRQSWGLFCRESYDYSLIRNGVLAWNNLFDNLDRPEYLR